MSARPTRYCARCGEYVDRRPVSRSTHRGVITKDLLVHIDVDGRYIQRNHAAVEAVTR